MHRRDFFRGTAVTMAAVGLSALAGPAVAQGVDIRAILHDPDAPEMGNPKGDVTIVAFTDYNCPYCKQAFPDLDRIVAEDGKIRLVLKDWPILTVASVSGARLALAARYQDGYATAHRALMRIPGRRIGATAMRAAIAAAGLDMSRLDADLAGHDADITALLKRNNAQAESLGLQGTPSYLIGPFRTSTLDLAGFRAAVVEARRRQAAGQGIKE